MPNIEYDSRRMKTQGDKGTGSAIVATIAIWQGAICEDVHFNSAAKAPDGSAVEREISVGMTLHNGKLGRDSKVNEACLVNVIKDVV